MLEDEMRRVSLIVLLGLLAIVPAACGSATGTGITPASDKHTFLFFYTDN